MVRAMVRWVSMVAVCGVLAGCATSTMAQKSDVDALQGQLKQLETQVEKTDAALQQLSGRFSSIESSQQEAREALKMVGDSQQSIRQRLESLSKKRAAPAVPDEK